MDQNNVKSFENERGLSTTETRLRLVLDETLSPILGEVLTASITCRNLAADFNQATKQTKITETFYQEQLNELTRKVDDIQAMLMTHLSHCQGSKPQVPSTLKPAFMNGVNAVATKRTEIEVPYGKTSIIEESVTALPSESEKNFLKKDHQKKKANQFSLKNKQTIQQSTNKFILTPKNVPTAYDPTAHVPTVFASAFREIDFSHTRVRPSFEPTVGVNSLHHGFKGKTHKPIQGLPIGLPMAVTVGGKKGESNSTSILTGLKPIKGMSISSAFTVQKGGFKKPAEKNKHQNESGGSHTGSQIGGNSYNPVFFDLDNFVS